MASIGYTLNATAMQLRRAVAEYEWFKNTFMVFDRQAQPIDACLMTC